MKAIYEFKCPQCGATQDKYHEYQQQGPSCEKCSTIMVKQFSLPAFHFTNGKGTNIGNLWSIR